LGTGLRGAQASPDDGAASSLARRFLDGGQVNGKLFLSYSSTDRAYVDRLVDHLQKHGVPVWYDPDIQPGARYVQVIEDAINQCSGVIVVMSRASEASRRVEPECAFNQNKPDRAAPTIEGETVLLEIN
jgi:hypothetical protein